MKAYKFLAYLVDDAMLKIDYKSEDILIVDQPVFI